MAINQDHSLISISRQCELPELHSSTLFYRPKETPEPKILIMKPIDEAFIKQMLFAARHIGDSLRARDLSACRYKIARLMKFIGIEAIYPKKKSLSRRNPEHKGFPYLLRRLTIIGSLVLYYGIFISMYIVYKDDYGHVLLTSIFLLLSCMFYSTY